MDKITVNGTQEDVLKFLGFLGAIKLAVLCKWLPLVALNISS